MDVFVDLVTVVLLDVDADVLPDVDVVAFFDVTVVVIVEVDVDVFVDLAVVGLPDVTAVVSVDAALASLEGLYAFSSISLCFLTELSVSYSSYYYRLESRVCFFKRTHLLSDFFGMFF